MTGRNWIAPDLALDDGRCCGPVVVPPAEKVPWGRAIEVHVADRLRSALASPAEPDPDSALFDRARANIIRAIVAQLAGGILRAFGRKAGVADAPFEWIPRSDWLRVASIDATPEPWRALFSRHGNAFVLVPGEAAWCQVWISTAPRAHGTASEHVDDVIATQAATAAFGQPAQDEEPATCHGAPPACAEVGMWMLVTTAWRWQAHAFPAGWVGDVANDAAAAMLAAGVAVQWPSPGEGLGHDPTFRAMPAQWDGGDLRQEVRKLVLDAPEVQAFTMFQATAYALKPPEVVGRLAVAGWRLSELPTVAPVWAPRAPSTMGRGLGVDRSGWLPQASNRRPASNLPVGRRQLSDHEAVRIEALRWWRQREIDRLMCEMFERLRAGEWKATGIRDDTPEALRVTVPPRCWDHPQYELTWLHDGAALRPAKGAPGVLPHYAQVWIAPRPKADMGSAGAESRCRRWLADLARAHSDHAPRPKAAMLAEAVALFGISKRGFGRVWEANAPAGWRSKGRPKSKATRN